MTINNDLTAIQNCINNHLDDDAIGDQRIAGVIGDTPSHYSKSPALWNAAFAHLGMRAIYLPFDVDSSRLHGLVSVLRNCHRFMGMNVTVPHKLSIMDFLDDLDPGAARVRAVNTVVRNPQGKLIGYNTDGDGFVESVLTSQPGRKGAFVKSLKGLDVLLLGAGGSARAVAFHVTNYLESGKLVIANRTRDHAASLAAELRNVDRYAIAIDEVNVSDWAAQVRLIVNSTTKGQGGVRRMSRDEVTMLEPFSSLAPAQAPVLRNFSGLDTDIQSRWSVLAATEVEANNKVSMAIAASIPEAAGFYDLIYHPEETVFLRHGRLTGHQTMNGKAMIINQAVIAFCRHICSAELRARGIDNDATSRSVLEVMYRAW